MTPSLGASSVVSVSNELYISVLGFFILCLFSIKEYSSIIVSSLYMSTSSSDIVALSKGILSSSSFLS